MNKIAIKKTEIAIQDAKEPFLKAELDIFAEKRDKAKAKYDTLQLSDTLKHL